MKQIKKAKVIFIIFLLMNSPFISKAENNAVASIEWLTVDADVIVRGSIIQVDEKPTTQGNQVTIKLTVDSCYKGMAQGTITIIDNNYSTFFKLSFYYDKQVLIFLKSTDTKRNFNLLKSPISTQLCLFDIISVKTSVYTGEGKILQGEKAILDRVKEVVEITKLTRGNMACIEPAMESEAYKNLWMGSRVTIYVPDNLYPNSKKCN
jgi:hypothetical protein